MNENAPNHAHPNPPPVDWERLTDLTGGETEGLRELVDLYLEQTTGQLAELAAAAAANEPEAVRRNAHSCGGATATLGMTRLAELLQQLEAEGKSGTLTHAATLCAEAGEELERVRAWLAPRL